MIVITLLLIGAGFLVNDLRSPHPVGGHPSSMATAGQTALPASLIHRG